MSKDNICPFLQITGIVEQGTRRENLKTCIYLCFFGGQATMLQAVLWRFVHVRITASIQLPHKTASTAATQQDTTSSHLNPGVSAEL